MDEQLIAIIEESKKISGYVVHYVLAETVKELANDAELAAEILKLAPYNNSAYVQIVYRDEPDYKLNICLSRVQAGYKAKIDAPAEYAKHIYDEYNTLKLTALAYYNYFAINNTNLIKKIEAAIGKIELTIDKLNPTVMYFTEAANNRIGIFPYYVDAQDKPLQK